MTKEFNINNVTVRLTKEQLEQMQAEFNKPEYDYPLAFKSKTAGNLIVVFTALTTGIEVSSENSKVQDDWTPHTEYVWEPIPYNEERGLYDKQPVACWDDRHKYSRTVRFYDALNDSTFAHNGERSGYVYHNYKPYYGDLFDMNPSELED